MLEDYDGLTDPSKVVVDGLYLSSKIHNIPERCRQELIVDELVGGLEG